MRLCDRNSPVPTHWLLLALASLLGCGHAPAAKHPQPHSARTPQAWEYRVRIDANLQWLKARACPTGSRAGCFKYEVPLRTRAADGGIETVESMNAVVLPSSAWLRRPKKKGMLRARLYFETPPEIAVSLPWPQWQGSYRLDERAFDFETYTAFGELEQHRMQTRWAQFEVTLLPGPRLATWPVLRDWLTVSANSVAQLFGRFPEPRVQVLLVPAEQSHEPVQLGLVGRGGASILFFLSRNASTAASFRNDWVATHELTHFYMPYVKRQDMWLPEGIATYYQEILRARSGQQTPAQAWQRLYQGMTAAANLGTGRTLAEESAAVGQTHAYRRVYWAGAALALQADVRMRRQSQNHASLDAAIRDVYRCCANSSRVWSAQELARQLDAAVGMDVWQQLIEEHLTQREFPPFAPIFRKLGVQKQSKGVRLVPAEQAEWGELREAITTGIAEDVPVSRTPSAASIR